MRVNLLQKVELESALRYMFPQLATLHFAARQAAHIRGTMRNNGFQLATTCSMQQCCATSCRKMLSELPDLKNANLLMVVEIVEELIQVRS